MKRRLSFAALLTNLFIALCIGMAVLPFLGEAFATGLVIALLLLVTGPQFFTRPSSGAPSLLFQGVGVEIWAKDITERLFPENDFMNQAIDDNDKLDGIIVHLPQIGTAPGVAKNRAVLPAVAKPRKDSITSYEIDEYTTDPTLIQLTDEDTVSYDKRMSVIADNLDTLETDVASGIANDWMPGNTSATNSRATTGAARPCYMTGQAGTRLAAVFADFTQLHYLLNQQNVPQKGRCLLVTPGFLNDMLQIEQFTNKFYLPNTDAVEDGYIANVLNFKIYVRSTLPSYSAAGALNALGAVTQPTDMMAAVAWHPRFVRRAYGNLANGGIKIFENPENPLYFGDIFSFLIRAGGSQARADGNGIVVLVEANG